MGKKEKPVGAFRIYSVVNGVADVLHAEAPLTIKKLRGGCSMGLLHRGVLLVDIENPFHGF